MKKLIVHSVHYNEVHDGPRRSCAACRLKANKSELVRIVRSPDGFAVLDVRGKLPGRGAYLCPDKDCIDNAKKSGSLARSLGIKTIDDSFWTELEEFIEKRSVNANLKLRSMLSLARRAGALTIGTDNIKSKSNLLVLVTDDCSENVKKFAESREYLTLPMGIEEISSLIGTSGGVQIIGLPLHSGFAKKIKNLICLPEI